MRSFNKRNLEEVTPAHLELGLLLSSTLAEQHGGNAQLTCLKMIAASLPRDLGQDGIIEKVAGNIVKKVEGRHLFFCGFEASVIDAVINRFESILIVPNSPDCDFERLAENYAHHPKILVMNPFGAANYVCPDTSIIVPLYPLQDRTLLTYSYPSKLLNAETRRYSFQIIGLILTSGLGMQYGDIEMGLNRVLSAVDGELFTDFITL